MCPIWSHSIIIGISTAIIVRQLACTSQSQKNIHDALVNDYERREAQAKIDGFDMPRLCITECIKLIRKTGVFPYDPSLIIDKITKPTTIEASTTIRTPMSCHAVRRVHRAYKFKPSPTKLSKILLANERLAAERAISQHIIKGLIEAFQNEKKRRKRGIRLNIAGEEGSGSIFFSPSKIQAAREFQLVKEEEEITRKQKVEEWKAQALIRKAEKEEERIQKKLRVEKARATKAAKRQAQLELKEMIKKERMEEV